MKWIENLWERLTSWRRPRAKSQGGTRRFIVYWQLDARNMAICGVQPAEILRRWSNRCQLSEQDTCCQLVWCKEPIVPKGNSRFVWIDAARAAALVKRIPRVLVASGDNIYAWHFDLEDQHVTIAKAIRQTLEPLTCALEEASNTVEHLLDWLQRQGFALVVAPNVSGNESAKLIIDSLEEEAGAKYVTADELLFGLEESAEWIDSVTSHNCSSDGLNIRIQYPMAGENHTATLMRGLYVRSNHNAAEFNFRTSPLLSRQHSVMIRCQCTDGIIQELVYLGQLLGPVQQEQLRVTLNICSATGAMRLHVHAENSARQSNRAPLKETSLPAIAWPRLSLRQPKPIAVLVIVGETKPQPFFMDRAIAVAESLKQADRLIAFGVHCEMENSRSFIELNAAADALALQLANSLGDPLTVGESTRDVSDSLQQVIAASTRGGAVRGLTVLLLCDTVKTLAPDSPFTSSVTRWAWWLAMRRGLQAPLCLAARFAASSQHDVGFVEAIEHLTALGGHESVIKPGVAYWHQETSTLEEVEEEVAALMLVADTVAENYVRIDSELQIPRNLLALSEVRPKKTTSRPKRKPTV